MRTLTAILLFCSVVVAGAVSGCSAGCEYSEERPEAGTPETTTTSELPESPAHREGSSRAVCVGVDLPLDSAGEAIMCAESDSRVKSFVRFCESRDIAVATYAKFDSERDFWVVVVYAVDAADLAIEVNIEPDGTIVAAKEEGG